jgi:hypothetical protein
MELKSVKFVKITEVDKHGKHPVADIPISQPQKIRAYIDMGDLQPKNAANNDHGWRVAPELAAKIRDVLEDPVRLEEIAKETSMPLDLINAFHVLMYEITRNRALAQRAAKNSLDKEQATAEYEREVSAARAGSDKAPFAQEFSDDDIPAPGTGKNYPSKSK